MLEKRDYLILLFDFYGGLLTEKQKLIFDLYYQYDLSLGEIAQEQNVSRQAIYDVVKRTESILEGYEKKLLLVDKFLKTKDRLQEALLILEQATDENISSLKLKRIIRETIEEI
ncbi:MAG: YlxM family DNA-binding protein [Bacillota bacterium]